MSCYAKSNTTDEKISFGFHTSSGTVSTNTIVDTQESTYQKLSLIASPVNNTDVLVLRAGSADSDNGVSGSAYNVMCIDLTKIYGSGNEPTVVTTFESDFNRWFGRAIASYEPYNAGTTPSGTSSVIFPDGMRSTPVAYDEIKKEDDNWVAYKRIKCLNLGNYTYTYNSDFKMFLAPTLSDGKYYDTNNSQINTKGYPTQWSFTTTNSESIPYGIILTSSNYGTGNKILKIRDINYTDATTLKNALQNHYLNYELDYPIRYILDNPISNIYKAETNGIEQILPENGQVPTTAPANLDITYKI